MLVKCRGSKLMINELSTMNKRERYYLRKLSSVNQFYFTTYRQMTHKDNIKYLVVCLCLFRFKSRFCLFPGNFLPCSKSYNMNRIKLKNETANVRAGHHPCYLRLHLIYVYIYITMFQSLHYQVNHFFSEFSISVMCIPTSYMKFIFQRRITYADVLVRRWGPFLSVVVVFRRRIQFVFSPLSLSVVLVIVVH